MDREPYRDYPIPTEIRERFYSWLASMGMHVVPNGPSGFANIVGTRSDAACHRDLPMDAVRPDSLRALPCIVRGDHESRIVPVNHRRRRRSGLRLDVLSPPVSFLAA